MNALSVRDVAIAFGGVKAVDGVGFDVGPGEVFAVIGPNGAGKTTLFNIICGLYRPSRGSIDLAGRSILGRARHDLARLGLSRTFQTPQIFFRMSVLENVMAGCHIYERTPLLADLLGLPATRRQDRTTREAAHALLSEVGLAEQSGEAAGNLAYGNLKKLEIARALAQRPRILLLDEPAAGCNATETQEMGLLIAKTAAAGVAVVLVEHDMKLVTSVSGRVLVLNQGRKLADGAPRDVMRDPAVIEAYLGTGAAGAPHA